MSDDPLGPPFEECPVCGAIGLPERIAAHDCAAFRASKRVQRSQHSTEGQHD